MVRKTAFPAFLSVHGNITLATSNQIKTMAEEMEKLCMRKLEKLGVIKRKNEYLYAFLKGEIDHHTAPEMREAIDDALSSSESCETLVLDFFL